jgi:hypothetical protein
MKTGARADVGEGDRGQDGGELDQRRSRRASMNVSSSPTVRSRTTTHKVLVVTLGTLAASLALVLASGAVGRTTAPASAGAIVDPNTLQPVPPNAVCRADGRQIICDTFVDEDFVNDPIPDFDLPCGTIYETSHYHGAGIRWYVDNKVVKREVAADLQGTWSLSPTGSGPTVTISGNWSFWTFWAVPGDNSTTSETDHGSDFKVSAPRFGVIVHDAGLTDPDGSHHGVTASFFTSAAEVSLCAALTR